jgi:hypothetical protein
MSGSGKKRKNRDEKKGGKKDKQKKKKTRKSIELHPLATKINEQLVGTSRYDAQTNSCGFALY